jgi:hypothetical protein
MAFTATGKPMFATTNGQGWRDLKSTDLTKNRRNFLFTPSGATGGSRIVPGCSGNGST